MEFLFVTLEPLKFVTYWTEIGLEYTQNYITGRSRQDPHPHLFILERSWNALPVPSILKYLIFETLIWPLSCPKTLTLCEELILFLISRRHNLLIFNFGLEYQKVLNLLHFILIVLMTCRKSVIKFGEKNIIENEKQNSIYMSYTVHFKLTS